MRPAHRPRWPASGDAPGKANGIRDFLRDGLSVLKSDRRFLLFLYTQWLAGATLMALPFYVVAAKAVGLG